ncbi:MAG: 16S rRNA (guanine(966)-N(2))-methyltransferase RsmD [Clostridia bacterium]|nr:16S rRNA (guanine(966)-N(2))-methyltransferase RsmD [Clostridia bacterium]
MRVITGIARGRKLFTLPGTDTVRPTSEKVKEAIFSAIQFDIEGRRVLDLFAGSGQLGIEALSRGADSAVFVDMSPASLEVVNKNLTATGLASSAEVIRSDYSTFLARTKKTFDIAFLDPPYKSGILLDALEKVTALLSDYAVVFCEHPSDNNLPDVVCGFKTSRVYRFGSIAVTMYKKEVPDNE